MKKSIILSLAATLLISFGFNNLSAQVSNTSYNYSTSNDFSTQVQTVIQNLESLGYNIVDYDITNLSKNQKFTWDLSCFGGREYAVFGYTEVGVIDLGVYIYDNKGNFVTANPPSENNGITATKFNAYSQTKAQIVVKNEKSQSSYKKYNVAVIVCFLNK
jgi:hypothetical protein